MLEEKNCFSYGKKIGHYEYRTIRYPDTEKKRWERFKRQITGMILADR